MKRRLAGLVLGAALSLGAAAWAEPLVLTPEGMEQAGLILLERGEPEKALKFAEALLQRDQGDIGALILKARAERDIGRYDASVATGRKAWRLAQAPADRHAAALAVAQGLASGDQRLFAQFWLRRALETAPDAQARAAAARDLRYVRTRTRLSLRADLDLRPSSNVNGGTSERILEFQGIPLIISPDARALSGWRGQIGLTGQFRLAESESAKTDLRFGLVERRVTLSDKAKADAPMAKASDYAFSAVELGFDQAWRLDMPGGEATLSATLGQNRYAGADMSRYGRLEFGLSRSFEGGYAGRLGLSAERQDRLDNASRSATIWGLNLGGMTRLASGDRLHLSLDLRQSQSAASEVDHNAKTLALTWSKAEPVFGAALSFGIDVTDSDYDRSRYSADGRHDLAVGARLGLAFQNLDYMGFIPVMTIEAEKTRSNVAINSSDSYGIGFSIRSSF